MTQSLSKQLQALVIERLKQLPQDMEMSIGDLEYGKGDLILHVRENDKIGQEVISMQVEFLQDLASGSIYSDE